MAILDQELAAAFGAGPPGGLGVEVCWLGDDLTRFRAEVPSLEPDLLVADPSLLGEDSPSAAAELLATSSAQMMVMLRVNLRRELRRALTDGERLGAFLGALVVRKMSGSESVETLTAQALAPSRFSLGQLGRLKELESAVDCECPANLADLLTQLVRFERYSARCESQSEKDAQVHRMLCGETGRARTIMERALLRLMDHEGIEL